MKRKNLSIVLNIVAIAGFILLATAVAIRYSHFLVNIVSNPQKFKSWVWSFGQLGVLVFILTQILQVIISAIPGEAVQISGGYLYGTLLGTVYSLIGIMIGSVCVFYITRLLGYSLVRKIVSEEKLRKFYSLIKFSKRRNSHILALFDTRTSKRHSDIHCWTFANKTAKIFCNCCHCKTARNIFFIIHWKQP